MQPHVAAAPTATDKLPRVRVATEADIPQLLQLGRMLHRENGLTGWAEYRIMDAAHRAVAGDGSVIGVIGPMGHVEAMIHLFVGRMWYSDDPHLEELYSFVAPEYRRSDNAKALVEFAKITAERLNIPLLIGIISNKQTEQKIRLYQRRLGKPSGAYFLYNKKTGF
jgi:GNAT superfamily N-acetyltransferase